MRQKFTPKNIWVWVGYKYPKPIPIPKTQKILYPNPNPKPKNFLGETPGMRGKIVLLRNNRHTLDIYFS
jgi:hypothetical protein